MSARKRSRDSLLTGRSSHPRDSPCRHGAEEYGGSRRCSGWLPRAHRPARPTGRGPHDLAKGEQVTYVIAFPCVDVKDKSCIEECPVDCIYEGDRMLYIQPDECVDCGACEPVCPVEAIFYEDDVPEDWSDYTAANAEFFADLGSPGGAAKLGAQDFDAALLASVPRKETES